MSRSSRSPREARSAEHDRQLGALIAAAFASEPTRAFNRLLGLLAAAAVLGFLVGVVTGMLLP